MTDRGWHPDPLGRHEQRFYDGTTWTGHVLDAMVPSLDPISPPAGDSGGSAASSAAGSTDAPQRPRSRRRAWIIAGGFAVVIIAIVAAFAAGDSDDDRVETQTTERDETTSSTTDGDNTPSTTEPRADEDDKPQTFTRENYALLATDPKRYEGVSVDIVGKVFGTVERDGRGVYFQMYADPKNYDWNTIVAVADPALVLADGDYVRVTGTVTGDVEGENAFGGTVRAVAILATSVTKTDATAAATPATRTVELGAAQDQHGVVVSVDRVEYAPDETRVFVTLTNNSGHNAAMYDFNAKALRGSEQFEPETNFEYPQIPSDVLPGVVASGVIAFPPMDPAPELTVVLEARNDNYRLDFTPYSFTVPAAS